MANRFFDAPSAAQTPDPGKRARVPWFRLLASVVLIAIVLYFADISDVIATLADVRVEWLGVAILCQLLGPMIISARWQKLLAAQGVTPRWRYLFASTLMSTFFRQFLPTIVGGDVIRAHHAMKAGAPTSVALMSLVVDRLSGLIALLILAIVGTLVAPTISERLPDVWIWISGTGIALCLALAVVFFGAPGVRTLPARTLQNPLLAKARSLLGKFSSALSLYRGQHKVLVLALLLSLALQFNVVIFIWAISMALDLQLSLAVFFVVVPIAIMVMMLPISINGIGLREGIYIFLLGSWGVSAAQAVSLAWIEYGIFLLFGLIGGVIYGVSNMRPDHSEAPQDSKVTD